MSEIFPEHPLTSLPAAVAAMGALPVPVGLEPQALSAERLAEIRSLDLLALMSDRVAPVISGHLAVLLAEIGRLEAQRDRRRVRLVDLQNDALNVRGALSPMGESRKVPFPLGPTLLPAVEWLIARVAELEAELLAANGVLDDVAEARRADAACPCPPADRLHQVGCPLAEVPSAAAERSVDELTRAFVPVASLREAELDGLRVRLPLDDPDRHALDFDADVRFARMACEHPDACACESTGGAR